MKKIYLGDFHSNMRSELVKKCSELISNGMKAIYILPSREAMFNVRELFMHELGGLYNCHIITFTDLQELLVKDTIRNSHIIGDYEAEIILRNVIDNLSVDSVFYSVKNKSGFITGLQKTIKRLKRLFIRPEDLNNKTNQLNGQLSSKLHTIHKVYNDYEKYKQEKAVIDIDDVPILALNHLHDSKILKETEIIVIDGFINIDPIDIEFMKQFISYKSDIDIYVNIPYNNKNNNHFIAQEVIADFISLGFEVEEKNIPIKPYINTKLNNISQNLYANNLNIDIDESILCIKPSPCIDHEVREAARTIKEQIIKQTINPQDIAIFCNNQEEFSDIVREVFEEFQIPININSNKNLLSIPIVKDIFSFIRLPLNEFRENAYATVMSSKYLVPTQIQENDYFDSNVFRRLAKKSVQKQATDNYVDVFSELFKQYYKTDVIPEELEKYLILINEFNPQNAVYPVDALKEYISFLNKLEIRKQLNFLLHKSFVSQEYWIRDINSLQSFENIVQELIETYLRYKPNKNNNWYDRIYIELQQLLSEEQTGLVNRDYGGVKFLHPDLARGQDYEVVYILGINEGVFPSVEKGNFLFSEKEITELVTLNINLGTPVWELNREKIRFNACLATARSSVFLSYRISDENGGLLIPSGFLSDLKTILSKESLERVLGKSISMRHRMQYNINPASMSEALRKLNYNLWHSHNEQHLKGHEWLDDFTKQKLHYSSRAAYMEISRELNPTWDEFDGKLNNPSLIQQDAKYGFSPSQLNSYVRCPFKYFAERVLDLSEEEQEPLSGLNLGILYHDFLKQYYDGIENPQDVDLERFDSIFNELESNIDYGNNPQFLIDRLRSEFFSTLKAFIYHDSDNFYRYNKATKCWLKPILLEQPFQTILGKDNKIRGVIDRIDLEYDAKGFTGRYIIYDYKKSGIKSIKECIEAQDFQLPIYYLAIDEYLKNMYSVSKTECIALLYYSIDKLEWKGIIRKDMKNALFESRKRPQLINKNNMNFLLEWVQGEILNAIDDIRAGIFCPPKVCPASFYGCTFSEMCRYDKIRLEGKGV